ncbi:hypothetical protein [Candidatus Flexifilum breve]|uniref:hypothetical protein n=1 Tax=Candidatus Flexifilum breve TaxID=3140694 RepID=UPI0033130881
MPPTTGSARLPDTTSSRTRWKRRNVGSCRNARPLYPDMTVRGFADLLGRSCAASKRAKPAVDAALARFLTDRPPESTRAPPLPKA